MSAFLTRSVWSCLIAISFSTYADSNSLEESAGPKPTAKYVDLEYAPPNFTNANGEKIIFVDISEAQYNLKFDAEDQVATAESTITFSCESTGHPVICIRQPVFSAILDGHSVGIRTEKSPDGEATFQSLSMAVTPGVHKLVITNALTGGPGLDSPIRWRTDPNRVRCLFLMWDLDIDGQFLETYVPSNFEFDHFKMEFEIQLSGSTVEHQLISNGNVTRTGQGKWKIDCPAYFTTSSPWFHLDDSADLVTLNSQFESMDGRRIPVQVYSLNYLIEDREIDLWAFHQKTHEILTTLENDFGPFPHETVTVLGIGMGVGGMEHSGMTWTGLGSLRHELDHSYFARGITPANGNAGWMDEAIAMWGDGGYPQSEDPPSGSDNMGDRSPYIRGTHGQAYYQGQDVIKHLDFLLQAQGGMKKFLKHYAEVKQHSSISAKEFQQMVERFHGSSLDWLFDKHVYGQGGSPNPTQAAPHHHLSPHEAFRIIFSQNQEDFTEHNPDGT